MTLVTGRLQRIYLKFYKELERIKAARRKPAEQPDESKKSGDSHESGDTAAVNLYWVDAKTGERTLVAQTPEAERLTELRQSEPPTGPSANECGPARGGQDVETS
jgi:hypothetical protein